MTMRGLQRSSEAKSGHRDSFASSTQPRLHAGTIQWWRGAGGRLPLKAAATTWLPLSHAVVPPHRADVTKSIRGYVTVNLCEHIGLFRPF